METIYLIIGSIALYLFWKFIWRRVICGYYRDRLFDLRDDLRSWAIAHGYSLENKQYQSCRMFLNSSLRYLEGYTTIDMLAFIKASSPYADILENIQKKVEQDLNSTDTQFNEKVKSIRKEAFRIFNAYMVLRSFPLCTAAGLLFIWHLAKIIYKRITVKSWGQPFREVLAHAVTASIIIVSVNAPGYIKQIPRQHNAAIVMSYGKSA